MTADINESILHQLGYAPSPTISEKNTKRWLKSLDITYRTVTKGIYMDGDEREDVVSYRVAFLKKMEAFESRMPFIGDGDKQVEETKTIWPKEDVRPLSLVTHDERTFSAHDGLKRLWMPVGEKPLRKKGQG